jgi:hypothetical protein
MSRKHKKHKKHRPRVANPTSWAQTILRHQTMDTAQADAIMVLIRTAFERLSTGAGTMEDFNRVGASINVAMMRAKRIDQVVVSCIHEAVAAMGEADRIETVHGKFGFTGPGLQAMKDALDAYEEILRNSTPLQMEAAEAAAEEEYLALALADTP